MFLLFLLVFDDFLTKVDAAATAIVVFCWCRFLLCFELPFCAEYSKFNAKFADENKGIAQIAPRSSYIEKLFYIALID